MPLDKIRVPVEIWHDDDDRAVSPEQSRILAKILSLATTHSVPARGHFLLLTNHAKGIMQSVLRG